MRPDLEELMIVNRGIDEIGKVVLVFKNHKNKICRKCLFGLNISNLTFQNCNFENEALGGILWNQLLWRHQYGKKGEGVNRFSKG